VRKKANDRKGRSKSATTRLLLLFGALLILSLILLATTVGGKFGPLHQLSMEALGPIQGFFSRIAYSGRQLTDNYVSLWDVHKENRHLKLMLEKYREQVDEYREAYATYIQLQNALEFKKQENFPSLTARIVGKDPAYWFKTIIVDRGENDGVTEGMVARTEKGVVGQVVHVSANYSKILLANAPSSAIDAMVQKNRVRGILKGAGEKGYILHYVLKNADVSVGDIIVTAGIGGLFKTGIPLGTVSAVTKQKRGMFLEIEVKPEVDFQMMEFVFLILSEKQKVQKEMGLPGDR
jgi:rod shape-determining protein MreC